LLLVEVLVVRYEEPLADVGEGQREIRAGARKTIAPSRTLWSSIWMRTPVMAYAVSG
jgi:hypothetical protein